jgi:MFS family permease
MTVGAGRPATSGSRYRLLALLYGSQFVPLAFVLYAMTAVLRQRGVPLEQIGILRLVALVWVVKFAWAPVVDRLRSRRWGHYRAWLLATQVLMVAGVLALVPLDAGHDLPLIVAVVVVVAVASATQDIATDATAVQILVPSERGFGNGIQKAGGYAGLMAGGGGALVVYDRFGWAAALLVLAALTALPLPALLKLREPAVAPAARPPVSRTVISFFGRPDAARWTLVVMPVYLAGTALSYPLLIPLLVDKGWPAERIGLVAIVGGSTVALITALGTGSLLNPVGRRRALVGTAVLQLAATTSLFLLARSTGAGTLPGLAVVALLNGAYAASGTVIYTVSMDWSRPATAGTDFTVQDSFVHLLSQLAGVAGLLLAGRLGYSTALLGAVLVSMLGTTAVIQLSRQRLTPSCRPGGVVP